MSHAPQLPRILVAPFALGDHRELRLAAVIGVDEHELLIGTASVRAIGQVAACLFQLHVIEGWRGCGVGTMIVRRAERECAREGATSLSAVVERGGPAGFWAALGYRPVHVEGENVLVARTLYHGDDDETKLDDEREDAPTGAKGTTCQTP